MNLKVGVRDLTQKVKIAIDGRIVEVAQKSLYDLAVQQGFQGTLSEYLEAIKGESAYEVAVRNGFSGTEKEWLASLQRINWTTVNW